MFGRTVEATIGKPGTEGKLIKDLRMSFNIVKTATSKDPNTCDLKIWNLNENSRAFFNEKDLVLLLKAGYRDEEEPNLIYSGDITDNSDAKIRPDIITTIKCRDGEKAFAESVVSVSYKDNTSLKNVLQEIVKGFKDKGIGLITNLNSLNITEKFRNGFSFSGLNKTLLDKIASRLGLEWSVQDQKLKLYPDNKSDNSKAIELNSNSGLLMAPERIKIKQGKNKRNGWKLTCLLLPNAIPGNPVSVKSKELNETVFTINKVVHTGDNLQSQFRTVLEVFE